jgi:glycosyltransferase involved in cell wall biosynthesis
VGRLYENSPPGHPGCRRNRHTKAPFAMSERNSSGARISVITPCLNGARYIAEAIDSVVGQDYPHTEHIVADGGSTDGTLELLSLYPHLKVIRGPDRGVYDALNKALEAAEGEIIGIMNSDDCYADNVFSSVIASFTDPDVMALAGNAVAFRGTADAPQNEAAQFNAPASDLLYQATLGNPCINAWFFRAAVFPLIGRFDASYKVAGDREFMLRLACSGLRCMQLPGLVCRYRIHAASMTFGGNPQIWETIAREHDKMTHDYLRKQDLPKRARKLVTQARTRDTLRLALRAARRHDWRGLLAHAAAGTRYDLGWPLRFAKRMIAAVRSRSPTA